jgi:hypothetical protein
MTRMQEEYVWKYILANRKASPHQIAKATGMSVKYVDQLLARISSENWREEVTTKQLGGQKFDSDKLRYDLLPPELLEEVARVLAFGAEKYSARNWELGMQWSRPFGAMMRHMWAWWGGEDKDPETGYSHLAHAACCIAFLVAYERRNAGEDDRPKAGPKK